MICGRLLETLNTSRHCEFCAHLKKKVFGRETERFLRVSSRTVNKSKRNGIAPNTAAVNDFTRNVVEPLYCTGWTSWLCGTPVERHRATGSAWYFCKPVRKSENCELQVLVCGFANRFLSASICGFAVKKLKSTANSQINNITGIVSAISKKIRFYHSMY